jgi:putative OPT family oligopeptide transporter
VLGGNLDWNLIGTGAAIGVGVILADELLRRSKRGSLPPLAVGMGIYLPMGLTLLIPVGAAIGHFYDRWAKAQKDEGFAERMGVLAATGLIVGESLFGVAFAFIAYLTDDAEALALFHGNTWAVPLALLAFPMAVVWLYAATRKAAIR